MTNSLIPKKKINATFSCEMCVYIFYAEDLNSDARPGKAANVPVSLTLAIWVYVPLIYNLYVAG